MLGRFKVANNVRCTLHTGINAVASSIVVDAASGSFNNFPNPSGDSASAGVGIGTLVDSLSQPTKTEVFTYTSLTNNGNGTFTLGGVTRGQDGSIAQSFTAGAVVMQAFTASQLLHPFIAANQSASTLALNRDTTVTGGITQQDTAAGGWRAMIASGKIAISRYVSGWKDRWTWQVSGGESGSNAGSNLSLTRHDDSGAALDANTLVIERSTGNVGIGQATQSGMKMAIAGDLISENAFARKSVGMLYGTTTPFVAQKTVLSGFGATPSNVEFQTSINGTAFNTVFSAVPSTGVMTIPVGVVNDLTFGTAVSGTQPVTPPVSGVSQSIAGSSADAGSAIMRFSTDGSGPLLVMAKARGSAGSPAVVSSGDIIGKVAFHSRTSAGTWKETASIHVEADGLQTSSSPTAMVFKVNFQSNVNPSEVLRFDSLAGVTFAYGVNAGSFNSTGPGTFGGGVNAGSFRVLGSTITVAKPATGTNDWNPSGFSDAGVVRLTGASAVTLNGLIAGGAGRIVMLFNTGTAAMTLAHENTGSTAANRFSLPSSINFSIPANDSATLWYDGTSSRWRVKR